MAQSINSWWSRRQLKARFTGPELIQLGIRLVIAAVVFFLAMRHDLWPAAIIVIVASEMVEAWRLGPALRKAGLKRRAPAIVMGVAATILIATSLREATQIVVAVAYGLWRWQWKPATDDGYVALSHLLVIEAVVYWAIFMMSAIWKTDEWLVLTLVGVASYFPVRVVLASRKEKTANLLAAVWALTAFEVSWVLVRWLYVYVFEGGYLMVPQAAVVLTAMAYSFGSIYLAYRDGKLNRSRLTEYLLIGLILIAIVITGTPWRAGL